MTGADRDRVTTALRRLDDDSTPDLWPEILRRADTTAVEVAERERRTRFGGLLVAAAAILAIVLVGAAVLRFGDRTESGSRISSPSAAVPWTVSERIAIPNPGVDAGRLIAASDSSVWVSARGGRTISVLDTRPSGLVRLDSTFEVPALAALTVDGDTAWLLDTNGILYEATRDGGVQERARLGSSAGVQPQLTVAGDAVWASGTASGSLVKIDPDSRSVQPVALDTAPARIVGTADVLWAATDDGRTLLRIDPSSAEVSSRTPTAPIAHFVARGNVAWIVHAGDDTLERVDGTDAPRPISKLSSTPTALAVGGGRVWVVDRGLLSGVDASSGQLLDQVSVGNLIDAAIASTDGALWVSTPGQDGVVRVGPGS